MRKIAVVVTARPSFARVRTVLEALEQYDVDVRIIMAASTHLHHYGNVERDCPWPVAHRVWSTMDGHTLRTTAAETGVLTMYLSHIFAEEKPDVVVTIADRHETLATAIAASYQHIPLAHIQGGERTGSIDDKVRDAVSQLADLHFPATEQAKRNLESARVRGAVLNYGCPSVDLAANVVARKEDANTIVVLQHPVTGEPDSRAQIEETYRAVTEFRDHAVLWFWPGQDAGSEDSAKRLRELDNCTQHPDLHFVRHLPAQEFLTTVAGCACLVGNSSVGIRECGYLGTPVVNIGTRQHGREHGPNVVHAGYQRGQIVSAIEYQLLHGRYDRDTTYGAYGNAGAKIAEVLALADLGGRASEGG